MSDDKPKPQIFAIMRNGHEVIRGGMTNVKEAIEKGNDMEAVKDAWNKLIRFEALHKTMEEGDGTDDSPTGFFKILDAKADGIVTQQGLYNLHGNLESLETSVSTAIESGDMDALQADYPKFMEENEAHLKQEEDVMMPSIKKMMMAQEPLKKFMCEEILPTVTGSAEDWEFFVKYANQVLEQHHGGMPRARVLDHALWAAATPDEWTVWNAWIRETLSEKTYGELQAVLP